MDALDYYASALVRRVDGLRHRDGNRPEASGSFRSDGIYDNPGRSIPETHKQWEERIAVAQKDGMAALLNRPCGAGFRRRP